MPPPLAIRRGFSGGKRLRERIGVAPGFVRAGGHRWVRLLPGRIRGTIAAQRAGDAPGQDPTMASGSGGTESAASGHLAPRPRRPPPPRVSPSHRAGCSGHPSELRRVPEAKHTPVWGLLAERWRAPGGWHSSGEVPGERGQGAAGILLPLPRRALCVCGFARVCAHACAGAAGLGSVVSAIWGRPWAPPGLSESARGAAAVPLPVTSLPGDTATRKVTGGVAGPRHGQMGWQAGRCAAGEWGPYFGVL